MDLTLSDEQRLLRESVERFITESYDADHRRSIAGDPLGFSLGTWHQFASLGWLALPIAQDYGGLGGGAGGTGIPLSTRCPGLASAPSVATAASGAAPPSACRNQ